MVDMATILREQIYSAGTGDLDAPREFYDGDYD